MVARDGDLALVDIGDARLPVPVIGDTFPNAGEYVRLLRVGQQTFLLGLARTRSALGAITANPGGGLVTVEYPAGSGVTADMRYPKYYTPVIGDTVVIDWTTGGTVIAVLAASGAAAAPSAGPAPAPAPATYRQTFTALDSGTQNNGGGSWWTNEVYAGDTTLGGWFYGTKIRDTIPDNAAIVSERVYLPIRQQIGAAPNLALHNFGSKPGLITYFAQTALTGARSGWITLPAGWGIYLAQNTSGLGMNHGGYNIYHGTQRDGMSGAVEITWTA